MSVFGCYHLHDLKDNEILLSKQPFYQQKMNVRGKEYKDVKMYSSTNGLVVFCYLQLLTSTEMLQ